MVSPDMEWALMCRTSFEVDSTGPQARVTAILFHEGQPFWRLDVIGSAAKRSNNAVGAVAETFRSVSRQGGNLYERYHPDAGQMLKRLGLAPLLKELYIIH